MHMSFDKIDPPVSPPDEPAAVRAARMIKELHLEQIAKMNSGFVFNKKLENGELVNCNDEMREACMEQIELCDNIMKAATQVPAEMLGPVEEALKEARTHIDKALATHDQETLPEIGNYDHKTD